MNSKPTNQPPEGMENCQHEPLNDTGVGYYHCAACGKSWTYHEWEAKSTSHPMNAAPPATVIQPLGLQEKINRLIKLVSELVYYSEIHTVKGVQPVEMQSHDESWREAQKWLWDNCKSSEGEYFLFYSSPPPLNLLKETVNNQHSLILSAEQRGYEKAKQEFTQPLGIDVEELIKLRNELYEDLPKGETTAWELLSLIKVHINDLDSYINRNSPSLPQSSTSEEEKDLTPQKFLETFEGFDFDEAFTDNELEHITNAMSAYFKYKISKI